MAQRYQGGTYKRDGTFRSFFNGAGNCGAVVIGLIMAVGIFNDDVEMAKAFGASIVVAVPTAICWAIGSLIPQIEGAIVEKRR